MSEQKFEAKAPDFKGDGIAIWKAQTKDNENFLKVKVLGGKAVNCFKFEPKIKKASDI